MPFITQGKTNWKFILIAVILAAIVGGGIFAWQYFGVPKEESKAPEQIAKDETANWQTYRNEEYGFEFKYPSGWNNPSQSLRGEVFELFLSEFGSVPALEYYPATHLITFDDFLQGPWGHSQQDVPEEIIINGIDAIKFSYITTRTGKGEYEPRKNVQVGLRDKKGGFFVINFSTLIEKEKNDIPLFDQIISTFRFIETIDTSNWQTYTNKEYGFEIKYPLDWVVHERTQEVNINSRVNTTDYRDIYIEIATNQQRVDYVREGEKGSSVTIAGIEWTPFLHLEKNPGEFGDNRTTLALLTSDNVRQYIIRLTPSEGGFAINPIFMLMLSTFSFLE